MNKLFRNKRNEIRSGWKIIIVLMISMLLQIALFFLVYILLLTTGFAKKELYGAINGSFGVFLLNGLSQISILIAVIIALHALDKKKLSDIGFYLSKGGLSQFFYGFILAALSMTVIFIILRITGSITIERGGIPSRGYSYLLAGLLLFVFVGVCEELFSRGYCMTVLKQTKVEWLPPIGSAIIFLLLHTLNPNISLLALFNIFFVGILFSFMYLATRNLMMPIGYHIAWNFFQGSIFGFPVSGMTPIGLYKTGILKNNILTGGAFGPEAGILTSIVIVLGLIALWSYKEKIKV